MALESRTTSKESHPVWRGGVGKVPPQAATRWHSTRPHVRFWERVGVRFPCATRPICHCSSEEQAEALRVALENRFAECGLTLHPEKTKIVYCKDDDRRGDYPNRKFDFLGYTFRPRLARRRAGKIGVSFSPAVSTKALKAIRQTVRRWSLQERSDKSLDDLARMFNAHIRGWINYYGRFYPSALDPTLRHIDVFLARWACRKFKALYRHRTRSIHWLERIARRQTSTPARTAQDPPEPCGGMPLNS